MSYLQTGLQVDARMAAVHRHKKLEIEIHLRHVRTKSRKNMANPHRITSEGTQYGHSAIEQNMCQFTLGPFRTDNIRCSEITHLGVKRPCSQFLSSVLLFHQFVQTNATEEQTGPRTLSSPKWRVAIAVQLHSPRSTNPKPSLSMRPQLAGTPILLWVVSCLLITTHAIRSPILPSQQHQFSIVRPDRRSPIRLSEQFLHPRDCDLPYLVSGTAWRNGQPDYIEMRELRCGTDRKTKKRQE